MKPRQSRKARMKTTNQPTANVKSFVKTFLSSPRLREWQQTHSQLLQMVDGLKLTINQEPASYVPIHPSIAHGLLSFIAQKVNDVDKAANSSKPNAASMSPRVSIKPDFSSQYFIQTKSAMGDGV